MRRLSEVSSTMETSPPGTREYSLAVNAHQHLRTLAVTLQWVAGMPPTEEFESMIVALDK